MSAPVIGRASWLAVTILVLCAARAADAEPPPPSFPVCCACLPELDAQSSQLPMAVQAVFCVQAANEEQVGQADRRCGNASGALECIDSQDAHAANDGVGGSCVAKLQAIDITCPVPGAPIMGHAGLAALTTLLVMVGVVLLRRRAAQSS